MHPIELDANLKLAKTHLRSGRFNEAEALYARCLKADPRSAEALHFLGLSFMHRGRLDQALDLTETKLSTSSFGPGESRSSRPEWSTVSLDSQDLYEDYAGGPDPFDGGLGWRTDNVDPHYSNDSPSSALDAAVHYSRSLNDSFQTYLMYLPPGAGSQWVCLARVQWSFGITVTQTVPRTWFPSGVSSSLPPAFEPWTQEPEWKQLVTGPTIMSPWSH